MIIEFIGLPGSGKTTIANRLDSYINDKIKGNISVFTIKDLEDIKKKSRLKFILKYLAFLFRPKVLIILVHALKKNPMFLWTIKGPIRWYLNTLILYGIIGDLYKVNNKSIFILDEGYIHRCNSLYVTDKRCPNKNTVLRYLKQNELLTNSYNVDIIPVFLDCSINECYSRLLKRGLRRFSFYNDNQKINFLENFSCNIQQLKDILNPKYISFKSCSVSDEQVHEFEKILSLFTKGEF